VYTYQHTTIRDDGGSSEAVGSEKSLAAEHHPDAIRERLAEPEEHSYLGDAILGGIDGGVTTFAVVSGAMGGGFSELVIVVLGFANLLADGSQDMGRYDDARGTMNQRWKSRKVISTGIVIIAANAMISPHIWISCEPAR
jgi:hypothetical protein